MHREADVVSWPFTVGDRVVARGNFGPLCCSVRVRYERDPLAQFEVVETAGDGQWLLLRDDDGNLHGSRWFSEVRPAYGHCYFRIVGACGGHVPEYRGDRGLVWEWECARCDAPTPEAVSKYWVYAA